MAEEITKTIKDVDLLFPQIEVNGQTYESERFNRNQAVPVSIPQAESQTQEQTQGQDVHAVNLNNVLHNFVDPAVVQALEDETTSRENADTALQGDIDDIEALIPNQASSSNQLADKNYVNTSIATNTANFLGTYDTLAEIEAIQNPTNNDYAYLQTQTASQLEYDRYKYNSDEDEWLFEFALIFPIGSGAGVAFIGTRAGYETAKLIPEEEEGHIPSGALVIITDEDDYVEAEER